MASIQNRSRFSVTVRNRPDLTRHFPFTALDDAEAYADHVRGVLKLRPFIRQEQDTWEVRVRQKGYPSQNLTCSSEKAALAFVKKVEAERSTGLFRDYTKAHHTTFAELLARYLREFKQKSAGVLAYKIEAWLQDSGPLGEKLLAAHRQQLADAGKPVRKASFQMRATIDTLEWIHKPLSLVTADDINGYIESRTDDVAPSTVDREVDIFSAVFNKAIRSWGYHLADNPMGGVERPKYFNERNRRLKGNEERRLLEAIRELDRDHSVQARVEMLLESEFEGARFSSLSAQKKVYAVRRRELLAVAQRDAAVVLRLETFFQFLVMTAARRGEALALTWEDIDFEARTAYLAETKNGRPRKLPLRAALMVMLQSLPRTSARVFDFGCSWLADMWQTACAKAGVENLRIHDLRHEAISRVAETSKFGLVDLQAFSGHRDVRMLLRYSHLCATRMASKLDEAFKDEEASVLKHKGRRRLKKDAPVSMRQLADDIPVPVVLVAVEACKENEPTNSSEAPASSVRSNVYHLPLRRLA